MTTYDMRIARVQVDDEGDWVLSVAGTEIHRRLWNDRDLSSGMFPGNSMGHRLIEEGWIPDRRSMYGALTHSSVERLALTELAGWRPAAGGRAWVIPCYREVD